MTSVRGLSGAEYGALQSLYYLVVVLTEVPSGVVADRLGRRTTLLCGALVNAAGCFVFAVARGFFPFAVGEVLFALGTAMISGADSAMLYDSLATERRQSEYPRAEGAGQATWLAVTALGLPLADLLLVRDGDPVLAYWCTGALSLLGAACAFGMREPPVQRRLSTSEITVGAIRDVARVPGILRLLAYSVGVFALLRAAIVMFFNPALKAAGLPVHHFGTVLAVVNVVGAATAWKAHRLLARFGERACMVALPAGMLVMYALLLPFRTPPAAALFCLQGAAFGIYPLLTRSVLNRLVPASERRATTLSIESLTCRLAFVPIALLAGWALDAWGLDAAIAATVLVAVLPFGLVPLLRKGTGRPATL